MSYKRFFGMIVTSTIIMYALMYATAYRFDDMWFSQTRLWMAVFMGAMMAVVMLAWMLPMYKSAKTNAAIFVGSAIVFAAGLFLARAQTTVDDVAWMKAMIPHHSIAILTSERASISDPRVRRLADDIILAQRREIAEMEAFIHDLETGDRAGGPPIPPDVPEMTGGSDEKTGPVPGAPALFADGAVRRGDVVVVDSVRVVSDAWVVAHARAEGGGAGRVLGQAFVQHGTSTGVPVAVGGAPGPVVLMLHDDTGTVGRYEFDGTDSPDQPLTRNGSPIAATVGG